MPKRLVSFAMEPKPFVCRGRPNPTRAHGAWIYLLVSVGAGALIGVDRRVESAMLVGTGFVGAFLVAAALSVGARRKSRQFWIGASLAAIGSMGGLWLDADPRFLMVAALALPLGAAAMGLEKQLGFLSCAALVTGLASLAIAAPVAAVAGGASLERGAILFAFLWLFFCWRTLRVAAPLQSGAAWDRTALRARGLREAAIATAWSLAVAVMLRIV